MFKRLHACVAHHYIFIILHLKLSYTLGEHWSIKMQSIKLSYYMFALLYVLKLKWPSHCMVKTDANTKDAHRNWPLHDGSFHKGPASLPKVILLVF